MILDDLFEARKVLYHGSTSDDPKFSIGHTGHNSHTFGNYDSTRYGIFFTNNPKIAEIYGQPKKYVVYPQKTFKMTYDNLAPFIDHLSKTDSDEWNRARYIRTDWEFFEDDLGKEFIDYLMSHGYDSAEFEEYIENSSGKELKSKTFVMLDKFKVRHDSGKQVDIFDKIYESTADNMNLLHLLVNIFFASYDELYYKEREWRNPVNIENPFVNKMNVISKYTDDEKILDALSTVTFYYDPRPYHFKDGNKTTKAAASYDPNLNEINFYDLDKVNKTVLAHELRHLIQYATYETKRKKSYRDITRNYRDRPVEIDAFWSDAFISVVTEYNMPNNKRDVQYFTKAVMNRFKGSIPDLSPKNEKHYHKKTAAGLFILLKAHHKGYEGSVDLLNKIVKKLNTNEELNAELKKDNIDFDLVKKLSTKNQHSLDEIPDVTLEGEKFLDVLSPPMTLHPHGMTEFQMGMAALYLMLNGDLKLLKEFYSAVLGSVAHEDVTFHDLIMSFTDRLQNPNNEIPVQKYMLKQFQKL